MADPDWNTRLCLSSFSDFSLIAILCVFNLYRNSIGARARCGSAKHHDASSFNESQRASCGGAWVTINHHPLKPSNTSSNFWSIRRTTRNHRHVLGHELDCVIRSFYFCESGQTPTKKHLDLFFYNTPITIFLRYHTLSGKLQKVREQ